MGDIDVGDGCWRRNVLETKYGDRMAKTEAFSPVTSVTNIEATLLVESLSVIRLTAP